MKKWDMKKISHLDKIYLLIYMALKHKMWNQGIRLNVTDLMFKALVNYFFGTVGF